MKTDWLEITSDEKKKIIENMAGDSASQIASQFDNCSRNAVIGFCHRNKIPLGSAANSAAAQRRAAKQTDKKPATPPKPRPMKVKPEPAPAPVDPIEDFPQKEKTIDEMLFETAERKPGDPVSMNDLTSWTCRWPLNHSYLGLSMSEMMFCGKRALLPEKYCSDHTAKAKGTWRSKADGGEKKPSVRLWQA